MRQAIIRNIAGPIHWRIYSALGGDVLNRRHNLSYMRFCTYPMLHVSKAVMKLATAIMVIGPGVQHIWYSKWGFLHVKKKIIYYTMDH